MDDSRTPADLDRLFAKLLEDELQPSEEERLNRALRDDPAVRLLYRKYMTLDAMLRWEIAPPLLRMGDAVGAADLGAAHVGAAVQLPHQLELGSPSPEPLIPPIIIDTTSTTHYPLFTIHSPLGGWLVSYAAATVITGVMLLVLWAWKVSQQDELAKAPTASATPAVEREEPMESVGEITGLADCRWADPNAAPPSGAAAVPLGRTYALNSGLMEITYQTGAKVILQGPCTYEVDSPASGFLSLGKLTARIEKLSALSDQQSEIPNPKSQISKFVVRTPTAIVTDLGTEFGVEVDKSGATSSHVFRGTVTVRLAGDRDRHSQRRDVMLRENESVCVERSKDAGGPRFVQGVAGDPHRFARQLTEPPTLLDLVDVVAGGDGFSGRRDRGIDVTNGRPVTWDDVKDREEFTPGDWRYHRVTGRPLVDGVFIPDGSRGPVQTDSAGHTFAGFDPTSNLTAGPVWAGTFPNGNLYPRQSELGGVDYASPGHSLLFLHANKAITFNLDAIRRANPRYRLAQFSATAGNSETASEEGTYVCADVWVLVDGQARFQRWQINRVNGKIPVAVPLDESDHFLTLASTDGGNGINTDWIMFGDPVLQMTLRQSQSAAERPPAAAADKKKETTP